MSSFFEPRGELIIVIVPNPDGLHIRVLSQIKVIITNDGYADHIVFRGAGFMSRNQVL